jgi:hypothetical protein
MPLGSPRRPRANATSVTRRVDYGRPTGHAVTSSRLKRAAVLAATAIVGLNVWTGSPLLALWIDSRVENANTAAGASMAAIAVVIATMVLTSWLLLRLLYRLQAEYARLLSRPPKMRRATWLRSMRAERGEWERQHDPDARVSAFELVVMISWSPR